jgi:hypothetical protein
MTSFLCCGTMLFGSISLLRLEIHLRPSWLVLHEAEEKFVVSIWLRSMCMVRTRCRLAPARWILAGLASSLCAHNTTIFQGCSLHGLDCIK